MKKNKIIYKGLFIDEWSSMLLKKVEGSKRLEKGIAHEHVTFEFRPAEPFPDHIMGKRYSLLVIGYGNDGENSGFQVELPKELTPYYKGASCIHITTSLSGTGKAQNTADLKFQNIEPFRISGQMGYFNGEEVIWENSHLKDNFLFLTEQRNI